MYVIDPRHYVFTFLATDTAVRLGIRYTLRDPSATSTLLRFLHEDEKTNGVLLYTRLRIAFVIFVTISSTVKVWGGVTHSWKKDQQTLPVTYLFGV